MSQTSHFDVVILGGGPAGAAAALALRKHAPALSLALIERSNYQTIRIGETLPPTAQPLLEQLGVWEAFLADGHLAAYGSCSAWGSDALEENEFIYNPLGRGWHLDRRRFDAGLVRAAADAGVQVHAGQKFISSRAANGGGWQLKTAGSGAVETIFEAKFVVDATGRRADFVRQRGVKKVLLDRLVGATVFFAGQGDRPMNDSYTLVEACAEGWWYSARLPDGKLVVVYMSDADLLKVNRINAPANWSTLLAATRHTKGRLGAAEPLGGPSIHAAHSHRLERMTGDGWLAVGDAAMTFDPLSSLGIFKGLRSGIMAAYAIKDQFDGSAGLEKYEGILAREFEGYLNTRMDYYRQETRWADSPFWSRRYDRVTLDPGQLLRSSGPRDELAAIDGLSMHLSADALKDLCDLCRVPRPAHEVVAEFSAKGSAVPDRRVILALQYLIEKGLIEQAIS